MKSALDIQSTFLDMLRSATAVHLHGALELCRAQTTAEAASVEQFPEIQDAVEQSACR
jgi:hypothetical protein